MLSEPLPFMPFMLSIWYQSNVLSTCFDNNVSWFLWDHQESEKDHDAHMSPMGIYTLFFSPLSQLASV